MFDTAARVGLVLAAASVDARDASIDVLIEAVVEIHLNIRAIADVQEVDRTVTVVALCVKRVLVSMDWLRREIVEVVDFQLAVQDGRIPEIVSRDYDLGKRLQFMVCRWPHINISQAIADLEGNHIAVRCGDALLATDGTRAIFDADAKMLPLTT